jgi:hypothetical protein
LRWAIPGSVGALARYSGQIVTTSSSKTVRSRWQAGDVEGDVVVAAAQVLHEGMTSGQDPR